jgi:protein-tyrosine kinase
MSVIRLRKKESDSGEAVTTADTPAVIANESTKIDVIKPQEERSADNPLYYGRLLVSDGYITDPMAAERFRILRAKIERTNLGERRYCSIAVTSAVPEEGKSFVAVNLARALGLDPSGRALLIDCDLRRPTINQYFGLPLGPGLTDLLGGLKPLNQVVHQAEEGLDVLTAGSPVEDPSVVVEQPLFGRYLHELKKRYRYIVIDLPPALVCPEPISVTTVSDTSLLVVRAWKTDKRVVQDAVKAVGKTRIMGVVLNGGSDPAESYSYYRYYGSTAQQRPKRLPGAR